MDKQALYGNYRAKVVDNKDTQKFGRVLVWIPDIMPDVSDSKGIWARPANNPMGGRNKDASEHYAGTSYIPGKGTWVWVFFEAGNINRPYYFGALDLENTRVLPENQVGTNYEKKWTLIKTHDGRAIVASDDPDDARIEITGKKLQLSSPPTGNVGSVYQIDGNQTTILLDEREGKQKVLIRTVKGDFLHVDIDERRLQASFGDDIRIECGGDFYLTVKGNINVMSEGGNGFLQTKSGNLSVKVAGDYIEQVDGGRGHKIQGDSFTTTGGSIHHRAAGDINDDACQLNEQGGLAGTSIDATDAQKAEPIGGRDS